MAGQKLQIQRLQQNLAPIRKLAGWTAEDLGEKIGVTKQTVSNLENGKSPMTLTQYIAIRAVLDYEMANNRKNTVLPQAVAILLDRDDLDEEEYRAMREAISAVSLSAAGGVSGNILDNLFTGATKGLTQGLTTASILLGTVAAGPVVGGVLGGAMMFWMEKLQKDSEKKKNRNKNKTIKGE